MPVPRKMVKAVNRSAEALRRLNVSEKALASAPPITSLLKQAAGGLKTVFNAMRLSDDVAIQGFLKKYDSLPVGDRDRIPIEAIALSAKVDLFHLLGAASLALQAQSVNAVKIIAVTSHPLITRARVKYAKLVGGERDRTALDTAMGFLPSPKGPTFIGKAIFGAGKEEAQAVDEEDDDPYGTDTGFDRLFPPANGMQERLTRIRQRMLPDTTAD